MRRTKNVFIYSLLGASLLTCGLAHAEDKGLGCGLGSMVAPKHTWVSATTEGVVNYFLPPTFSMTTGTSGCAEHAIVMKDREAIFYAEANYQKLEVEIPKGRGEYLASFTRVLGCQDQSRDAVTQALKNNYERLFPAEGGNADLMLRNVQSLIRSEPTLACSVDFVI